MIPEQVLKVPLPQIASSQQDAVVFDANNIQSLASEQEIFLIFYLSKEDESNGYGTVIQLDPQSKQAAIYSDLNPEYAYLFFQNEHGQLQSLLWCIEIATRTNDGLFIAHAKSYGRGITEEDLRNYAASQTTPQPEPARKLAEEYTPTPPQPVSSPAQQSTLQPNQPQPAFTQSASASNPPTENTAPQPLPTPAPAPESNPVLSPTPDSTTTPMAESFQPTSQPNAASTQGVQQPLENNLTNPITTTPSPAQPETNSQPFAPTPQYSAPQQPVGIHQEQSSANAYDVAPFQPEPSSAPSPEPQSPPPAPSTTPDLPAMDVPDIFGSSFSQPRPNTQIPTPKQAVGRPQKQLVSDQLWPVSQQDFMWAKNMSRSAIGEFRDVLWEKVIHQIRTNRPGLIEDWEFHGAFEKAFDALCATYDLIPALRHDILKSLLNGRVIDSVSRQHNHHH